VSLTDELDAVRIEFLRERAERLVGLHNFDRDQFHVYFHLLTITRREESHFGVASLECRLEELELVFSVNQKQVRSKKIRFFNYLVDSPADSLVTQVPNALRLRYTIKGEYLARHDRLRTEIITFVARNLPQRHRKIKATLIPTPTPQYKQRLHTQGDLVTQFDFRFRKAILLRAPEADGSHLTTDPPGGGKASSGMGTVFISYNHSDAEIADKLKVVLEQHGIVVRIDRAVMEAGANIEEFIESSIRDTAVTLSIVSNRSLLSAWVALESIATFYREKLTSSKKFIACYIDEDFFQDEFQLNATKQIDARMGEIDRLIPEYNVLKIDTNDLNSQKTRLYKLRNSLGDILLRLKDSLSIDIREDKFDENVAKIVSVIKGKS
jgi:hypothetical protein